VNRSGRKRVDQLKIPTGRPVTAGVRRPTRVFRWPRFGEKSITPWHLFFIAVPLVCIVVPSLVTARRHSRDGGMSQFQMFFVWLLAYSMLVAACGFLATILVFFAYGGIPGTASSGGLINGQYYFNWHDETYTQVAQQTWEQAWFLEQLSQHFVWVPIGVLVASFAILLATKPFFARQASNGTGTNC
jgi:hypothetical protein